MGSNQSYLPGFLTNLAGAQRNTVIPRMSDPARFLERFLELPGELRNDIFEHMFPESENVP